MHHYNIDQPDINIQQLILIIHVLILHATLNPGFHWLSSSTLIFNPAHVFRSTFDKHLKYHYSTNSMYIVAG